MDLILTSTSKLPKDLAILLNKIALELRPEYNLLIEQLGKGNENNMDWWVSELANRNTLDYPIYEQLCYVNLVDKMISDGQKIDAIILDNAAIAAILKKHYRRHNPTIRIKYKNSFNERIKKAIGDYLVWFININRILKQYYSFRQVKLRKTFSDVKPITLVDTFLHEHRFKNGKYKDVYFNYWNLSDEELTALNIYYVPTYTFGPNEDHQQIIKNARNSKEKFIIKEDYLKINDYIFALLHPLRMLNKIPHKAFSGNIDVTPLFLDLWKKSFSSHSCVESLLRFRLMKRLNKTDVKIRLIIDWFENQNIDKAFIAGCKKYFPETTLKGYMVAIGQEYYLNYFPQTYEYDAGIIHHKLAVSGSNFAETVKKNCPKLKMEIAPAYRHSHVWNNRVYFPDKDYFTLLVALPSTFFQVYDIMEIVREFVENNVSESNFRIWIKIHHDMDISTVEELLPKNNIISCEIINMSIAEASEKSNVILGNTSSSLFEAFVKGVSVIIIGSRRGLTHNPIPAEVSENLYRICFSSNELSEAIVYYKEMSENQKALYTEECKRYKDLYFEPVDLEKTRKLFELDSDIKTDNAI